ncbi:DUF4350 domain-containing protein [Gracilibacillus oryzae]|uniref:DUF4350 domain-containing protein n=1 Tax=Gracilibacillus oryzae TaxID=1672701 RepID=A0A7C8GV50_9BACI|nr:DUF4350 domain-containing protein [Gracilibacillus oryzae]KAB8137869.1 DUF4350 domain-containing protein [Gracilibacillus oryzae]
MKNNRDKKIYLYGVFAFIMLIIVSMLSTSNSPKEYPNFVTESPSPTGTKALYTYLQEQDIEVETQAQHPTEITSDGREVRMLMNPSISTDEQIADQYKDYMMDGNTIILWKYNPDGLFELETEPVHNGSDEVQTVEVQFNNQPYDAQMESNVRLMTKETDQVLLEDEFGVVGLERQVGNGTLITILEPGWLTNDFLTEEEHTALVFHILSSAEGQTLVFDQYKRNSGEQIRSHFSLYPDWAYVLLVEGILLTILLLWHQGKRFGPILPVREEHVRFSDERIRALAIWYLKGKNYHTSLVDQANFLREVIRERYGIPYSKDWKERLELLDNQINIPAKDLQVFAKELEHILQQENIHKQTYLQWSKTINNIRKEVEKDE